MKTGFRYGVIHEADPAEEEAFPVSCPKSRSTPAPSPRLPGGLFHLVPRRSEGLKDGRWFSVRLSPARHHPLSCGRRGPKKKPVLETRCDHRRPGSSAVLTQLDPHLGGHGIAPKVSEGARFRTAWGRRVSGDSRHKDPVGWDQQLA